MPRRARLINEKQVYHVMLRGNNRENIFIDVGEEKEIDETNNDC